MSPWAWRSTFLPLTNASFCLIPMASSLPDLERPSPRLRTSHPVDEDVVRSRSRSSVGEAGAGESAGSVVALTPLRAKIPSRVA